MGRVLVSGTQQTVRRWWWYQAARDLTGAKRAGSASTRAFGSLLILWFGGGTLWALGILGYVLAAGWFIAVGIFAEVGVEDTEPHSPTGVGEGLTEEFAGQSVGFVTMTDLDAPSRSRVVWIKKETS